MYVYSAVLNLTRLAFVYWTSGFLHIREVVEWYQLGNSYILSYVYTCGPFSSDDHYLLSPHAKVKVVDLKRGSTCILLALETFVQRCLCQLVVISHSRGQPLPVLAELASCWSCNPQLL